MTDQQSAAHTPAGWYPDPAGTGQNRWWDGYAWADAYQPVAQQVAQPGSPVGMPAAMPYTAAAQNLSTENPTTPFTWVIALWPLLAIINLIVYGVLGGYSYDALTSTDPGPWGIADTLLAVIAYLGFVAIAFLDHRAIKAKGLQPFPWGWAFLQLVYVIGRTVYLYRQTRRGLAPLFIYIGGFVLVRVGSVVIGLVIGLSAAA